MIGAGTTGSAIAHALAERGLRPLLVDRAGAAGGTSGSSAGMLRRHYRDPAIVSLARYGCEFLADMEQRTGSPSGYVGCGYLVVADASRENAVREAYAAMRACGVAAELVGVDRVRDLEPRLRCDDLTIGCYEADGGYCDPLYVASGLALAAERAGATLRLDRAVRAIVRDGAGYRVELESGESHSSEICVVACGAWSNELLAAHGAEVPLVLRRGQIGRFRPPAAFGGPGPIVSDHLHELWIRPDGADGHYLVGGRGGRADDELAAPEQGYRGADAGRLGDFARELAWRLPGTAGGIWRGSWASFYDFTPDENPVVDRVPGHDGLYVATGGSGHAFKLAPALGLGAAELICDGEVTSFDWTPLCFGRFA
ncbi:MAG TPA: FAD-dependent oxidoreductase [Gaiellales bacterium]